MIINRAGRSKTGGYKGISGSNTALAVIVAVLSAVMAAAVLMLAGTELVNRSEQAKLDELSGRYGAARGSDTDQPDGAELVMLPGFEELYRMNNDFCGWIKIDGTNIDYPVMNSPYDPEYYLYRAFDRSQTQIGTPFVGQAYSLDTAYTVLYAHNRRDGIMFSTLPYYRDRDYYRGHSRVQISNLYEQREYEVFAACECNVEDVDPAAFKFYSMQPYPDERSFYRITNWFKRHSYYDTGIDPVYGEQVIVLATCSDFDEDNRFLVALKKL